MNAINVNRTPSIFSKAWVLGLVVAGTLTSCGGDDPDADNGGTGGTTSGGTGGTAGSGTGGSSTSSGLPNACELFTLAETAPYGPLEQDSHHTSDALDLCIYGGVVDGEVRQVSVSVLPEVAFQSALDTEERVRPDATKTGADYGDESYVYVTDTGATIIVLSPPYTVGVTVRLMTGAEAAARDVMTQVLARLST